MESEHIWFNNAEEGVKRAYDILEDYMFRNGIEGKNAMRLTLLTEEALRLVKSIARNSVTLWLEGDAKVSRIFIMAEEKADANEREQLVSVSTTLSNSAKPGFFGKLLSTFSSKDNEKATWSLSEYKSQVLSKRKEDAYAQESWDDLERSLLANLANDIDVSVEKDRIVVVITKSFVETLSNVGSKASKVTTQQIVLDNREERIASALEKADQYIGELDLPKKDSIQVKLLFEEMVGMLKELTGEYEAVVWFERYEKECCIRMTAKTEMDTEKKTDLLGMSTSGRNASAKGFMDKLADVVESGLMGYDEVMKLQQKYGGGMVSYGSMGMYDLPNSGMIYPEMVWSLYNYKDGLNETTGDDEAAKEAWDELERSIVASIAKDVVVGVKKNRVDITMVKDIA